jgi:hypothetical protein
MNLLNKIKYAGHRKKGIRNFCIQTIRFKKFLENARALLNLFADGREKILGEYIFDRHYVITLIDSVVDRLGMLVYDASVLAPENGEELYATYDRHKLTARDLISSGVLQVEGRHSKSDTGDSNPYGLTDPEYQLLSEVLQWFQATRDNTVMDFIKQTFSHVIQALESTDTMANNKTLFEKSGIQASDIEIFVIDLWKDALSLPSNNRSIKDFNSNSLRHLLMDAGSRGSWRTESKTIPKTVAWVAAVSENQLSLNTLKPDFRFRLETLASGHESSDFIFISADPDTLLDKILPDGFHVERTDYKQFAWSLDISAKNIEDNLMTIGQKLFGESA